MACKRKNPDHTDETERDREKDDKGIFYGFKLGGHDHVNKDQTESRCHDKKTEGFLLFFFRTGEFI